MAMYNGITYNADKYGYPDNGGYDLFNESFEATGYDLTGWSATGTIDPDAVDVTSPDNGGNQCLKLTCAGAASSVYRSMGSDQLITYTTFYVYVDSHALSSGSLDYLARGYIASWSGNAWFLKLYNQSGVTKFQFGIYTGSTTSTTVTAAINTGTWYRIRIRYDGTNAVYSCSYTPAGGSEIDVASGSLTATYRAGWAIMFLGTTEVTTTMTVHYDRIMIGSTGFKVDVAGAAASGFMSLNKGWW